MGKKLAIRGHSTRDKEVIELLEMMGGTNPFTINDGVVIGNKETSCYHVAEASATKYISWDYIGPEAIDKYEIFTLEEFLEKYPYKIGDKIPAVWGNPCTVKSMSWDENYKTVMYGFEETVFVVRADELKVTNDIGLKIEKNTNMNIEFDLTKYSYEVKDGRLVISEKKPVYPKTYEECRAILNYMVGSMSGYKASLLASLQDLLICRDAYWKIAGKEMGLGKPWKPEYATLEDNTYFTVQTFNGEIDKSATSHRNVILAFPTEEMRDAFYENFKHLIEQCKELL